MQYQALNRNVVIELCLANIVSANSGTVKVQHNRCPALYPQPILSACFSLGPMRHYLMVSRKSTLKGGWTKFRRYVNASLYLTYSGVIPPYIFCEEISR